MMTGRRNMRTGRSRMTEDDKKLKEEEGGMMKKVSR